MGDRHFSWTGFNDKWPIDARLYHDQVIALLALHGESIQLEDPYQETVRDRRDPQHEPSSH